MTRPLRTLIVGFGSIADTLGDDKNMRRFFGSLSHAEALAKHQMFDLGAVLDPAPEARLRAVRRWGIERVFESVEAAVKNYDPEIVVITSPPGERLNILNRFKGVKGVFLEKPLGGEAKAILNWSIEAKVPVQVNYWRRAVPDFIEFSGSKLTSELGEIQAIFGTYGNGLRNNGSHLIDFARMLIGEVESAHAIGFGEAVALSKVKDDVNVGFCLLFSGNRAMVVLPVNFIHFREVSIDFWGTKSRLSISQESLLIQQFPLSENRGLDNELEINSEQAQFLTPNVRQSLDAMYENLYQCIACECPLLSSLESAVQTEKVVSAIEDSISLNNQKISL